MRRWGVRLILLLLLAGLGFWVWQKLFPGPEAAIRRSLENLARLASFESNEAPLAKLSNSKKLVDLFSGDAEIVVDAPGRSEFRIRGQKELLDAAMGARQHLVSLKVEFLDITVTLGGGGKSAEVSLTGKARFPGERDDFIQELKFYLRKIDGDWLITRVETVKTLSASRRGRRLV